MNHHLPTPDNTNALRGISLRDLAELGWFYGQSHSERSIQGPCLDRAYLYAVPAGGERELTARPTGAGHQQQGIAPNEGEMLRYGQIARRLSRVSSRERAVLEAAYGDLGAWALRARAPRSAVLLPATAVGQRILLGARTTGATHRDVLVRSVLTANPPPAGLAGALRECECLLDGAHEAFARTGHGLAKVA